jgi:3-methyladenine DNA glycosylase AlkD
VAALQARLDAAASAKTRAFWEKYLRGSLPFRGASMAAIREAVHRVWREHGLAAAPLAVRKRLALALLRERHGDDKLAGIVALAELLLADLDRGDLPALAALFDEGHVADWSTCDWLCVKVLGPFVLAARGDERRRRARAVAAWRTARDPWRRRAAAVAFVNLARQGERCFPGLTDLVLAACDALSRSPERFHQTGAAWVLRELHAAEPERVLAFLAEHAPLMTPEAKRQALPRRPTARPSRSLTARRRAGTPAS